MKRSITFFCFISLLLACNNTKEEKVLPVAKVTVTEETKKDTIVFPYEPLYSSRFNNEVSDKDLLTVLNSFKFWENGLLVDLAGLYADTVTYIPADGNIYEGPKTGLIQEWTQQRDSIKSIQIEVISWTKVHEIAKGDDYIDLWYIQTIINKSGIKDKANYVARKQLKNGKIIFSTQYRQESQ